MKENTKVVVDDTTIYEVDMNCYHCLSEQERHKYFPYIPWEHDYGRRDFQSDRNWSQTKR